MPSARRIAPAAVPILFATAWVIALAVWPVPAVIDWRIIGFIVVLASVVMGMQAAPLIHPGLREWGLGAGILGALLAPFGASVTVLALFSYRSGDLGPGWEQSWSVFPALAIQAVALIVVVAGLVLQRLDREPASHRLGRWLAILGTLAGSAAAAAHLYAVAYDIV